jgi:hypothetical protein
MELTKKDIRLIKYERRLGFSICAFILAFGGLFNVYYIYSIGNKNLIYIVLIDISIICFGMLISYLINRNYNKDIKVGIKVVRIENVQSKENQVDYEAGSGTLHSPILSKLFPKIWGQEMKPINRTNLIINNSRYSVDNSLFDEIHEGDFVEMHYTQFSEILLGIEKHKNK